jgi:hypothetical protein
MLGALAAAARGGLEFSSAELSFSLHLRTGAYRLLAVVPDRGSQFLNSIDLISGKFI